LWSSGRESDWNKGVLDIASVIQFAGIVSVVIRVLLTQGHVHGRTMRLAFIRRIPYSAAVLVLYPSDNYGFSDPLVGKGTAIPGEARLAFER